MNIAITPTRLKRMLHQPKVFLAVKPAKKPRKYTNLYAIEIAEADRGKKMVRIHYKGYEARFDEWRPYGIDGEYFPFVRHEKLNVVTNESLDERISHFT